jgi:hypothetical protein
VGNVYLSPERHYTHPPRDERKTHTFCRRPHTYNSFIIKENGQSFALFSFYFFPLARDYLKFKSAHRTFVYCIIFLFEILNTGRTKSTLYAKIFAGKTKLFLFRLEIIHPTYWAMNLLGIICNKCNSMIKSFDFKV